MWIIDERGCGINLDAMTVIVHDDDEDRSEGPPYSIWAKPSDQPGVVIKICDRDTVVECKETIKEIVSEMCGWIAPGSYRK